MLTDREWNRRYTTSDGDLVEDFYRPALQRSVQYDRAVGYFRSSVYLLTGPEVAQFALSGGRMRVICSPSLVPDDAQVIRTSPNRKVDEAEIMNDLAHLVSDPTSLTHLQVLGSLLALNLLEIRFAFHRGGIFHDKVGIFTDEEGNQLTFSGSVNETWKAWARTGNHESLEAFADWRPEDHARAHDHNEFFADAWSGNLSGVETLTAPRAFIDGLVEIAGEDPSEKLAKRAEAYASTTANPRRSGADLAENAAATRLFPHQEAAIASWKRNGRSGLLKHATGSGKTITALFAAREWLDAGGNCLVLVPSVLLLDQWITEAERELSKIDVAILGAGGRHGRWRSRLRAFTEPDNGGRCLTIATMQTATSAEFRGLLQAGQHLLVIADEVHRMGSSRNRKLLTTPAGARLGLSATPERYGDPDGTEAIIEYFGEILEPQFDIRDAIEAGRLTPYEYHPFSVRLTGDEEEMWIELTESIRSRIAMYPDTGFKDLPPDLQIMILNRSRIVKGASVKAPSAVEVLTRDFKAGQYWLVYCEDSGQLRDFRSRADEAGLDTLEYHTAMVGDGEATLEKYQRDGGILAAIRCLDEGVDIPAISHAIILASSRNPREFIQRRGRVLRQAPHKPYAVIHDALVEPPLPALDDALTVGEIARAQEFAEFARNSGALTETERIAARWGISLDDLDAERGVEVDIEEGVDSGR